MSKVFLISGLGADYRLFKNLDLGVHDVVHVHWIVPAKTDTLSSYATKLIEWYDISEGDAVIGVSLGGMLTVEIAKQIKLSKAVLISSIKSAAEIPSYFSFFRRLPIHEMIPGKVFTSLGFLISPVFGHMGSKNQPLFKLMLQQSSPEFVKWAMRAVLQWQNTVVPDHVYHFIGDKDLVFDYKRIQGAIVVRGGTHIMVYDMAKQISKMIREILKQ